MAFPKRKAQRFAMVSGYFPPIVGGTSTVIGNLLRAFKPEAFSVVSEAPGSFDGLHNATVPAGVSVARVGVPEFVTRKIPYGMRLSRFWRYGLIPSIERKILATGADLIVAVYPSWPFLIAAYRSHLRMRIPLVTYYMDVSSAWSQLAWPDRPAVKLFEPRILQAAVQRLVLSEALAADFKHRFSLGSVVVPHSIDLAALPRDVEIILPQWQSSKLIVHTGVVEGLQREGLKRLARVIAQHPELNARLILCTPSSKEDLLANGFDLPCVEVVSLKPAEVLALQRQAHVLVAMLPFDQQFEAHFQTAFPTKVTEYMAAGVPILAHAPAGGFFARHVSQGGYALLVDEPNEERLFVSLRQIMDDPDLRRRLIEAGRSTVAAAFDLPKVARTFVEACRLDERVLK
jgi:glycosyltransferase involved in cell wall biosynthesis